MTEFPLANRLNGVTYAIRDIVAEAKKVEKNNGPVLYLNIGDPLVFDFKTPDHLLNAVKKAMENQKNGYAPSEGSIEAREAISRDWKKKTGLDVESEDVIITSGVSEGISFFFSAFTNPGESILLPRPGYPIYDGLQKLFGLKECYYCLDPFEEWRPDFEDIRKKINEDTKALVIINPNNPTGAIYSKTDLKKLIDLAGEFDLVIVADEIYDKLVFDKHIALASIANDIPVLTFNGLSKNWLAPGWRTAWGIFHDPNGRIEKIKEGMFQLSRLRLSGVFPMQFAVKAALEGPMDYLKPVIEKLKRRGDLISKRLNEIEGVKVSVPKGAFYVFPKIPALDDKKFSLDLLRKERVLGVHGSGFGMPGYIRLVFLMEDKILEEAMDRFSRFVRSRR